MASDILVCPKCGDRVLTSAAKDAGLEKCPYCKVAYKEEKTAPVVT